MVAVAVVAGGKDNTAAPPAEDRRFPGSCCRCCCCCCGCCCGRCVSCCCVKESGSAESVFTNRQVMPRLLQRLQSCLPSHLTFAARQLWQAVIGRRTKGLAPRLPELCQLRMKLRGISPFRDLLPPLRLGGDMVGAVVVVVVDSLSPLRRRDLGACWKRQSWAGQGRQTGRKIIRKRARKNFRAPDFF